MIFVTPDGERSMNTYLGACVELGPEDIEADKVAASKVTFFEGYLWDPPRAKDAIRGCAEIAHKQRPGNVDDAVRPVLRRPLPRRVSRADALRHRRHRLRQ
jgi:sugar/nucleoside kinase (ribokinase family)